MVKAFSYGSGDYEIAKTLETQKVDYLGVAFADEGILLREKGIKTPIIVMNSSALDFENLIKYQLEPEIYSTEYLQSFANFVNENSTKPESIHLKLDTGMHRLGIQETEITELQDIILKNPQLKIESIFSHLAASDEPEEDAFTLQQIETFDRLSIEISSKLKYPILRHILNSSGIERFPEFAFDMVRLGIGIYGINYNNPGSLRVVNTLKTKILQVKEIKKGETIGYCRNGKANENMQIAIIAIGYADGFLRTLGNGNAKVLINEELCPTIGNISMDTTVIDITNIEAKAGDEVEIFGKNSSVSQTAHHLKTIEYEVFTSISRRVTRTYLE